MKGERRAAVGDKSMMSRRIFIKGVIGSVAALIGTGSYALGFEPMFRLQTQRYAVTPPSWPKGLNLRIAVVADLHVGEPHLPMARLNHIVDVTNDLEADLIVLLVDFAAGHRFVTRQIGIRESAPVISRLKAPLGVYSILGYHDWWDDHEVQRSGAGPTLTAQLLPHFGIPVLENDVVRLDKDGQEFWLAGLGDQLAFPQGRGQFIGVDDLSGTLAKVTDAAPVILLAHEPDIFVEVFNRVALTLSGHTHGGQLRLFGYSPNVPSRYGNRFAYGHVVEDGRNLIVSGGGLGTSVLPIRFGVPPEIVVVQLGEEQS
jgi:hypothetical protein